MKIDVRILDIVLARRCESAYTLRRVASPSTLAKIRRGGEVSPRTVGRIARELGVEVEELLEDGGRVSCG